MTVSTASLCCVTGQTLAVHSNFYFIYVRYLEYLSDCCLTPNEPFFQLHHGEKKCTFNKMIMMSALY